MEAVSFNEAAGRTPRMLAPPVSTIGASGRFNEAAGRTPRMLLAALSEAKP